jgi:hypothetical protein
VNRESLIFCVAALVVALAVCAAGFRLETLPDVDLGGGFGRVSVIDLIGYYIENPPATANAAGGDAAPAARRFGGC